MPPFVRDQVEDSRIMTEVSSFIYFYMGYIILSRLISVDTAKDRVDSFEDNTNRVSIVMLEACYSGSFIDQLADTDRVIFSSSGADKYSFLSDAGDVSFSQFLSTYLLSGYNWEESFDLAANDLTVIGAPYAGMNPQKAIGSQVVLDKVFGDFSMTSFLPKIDTYTAGGSVVATGGSECDFITSISTAWKWVDGNWAVYLPGEDDGGAAYAQSNGFAPLENINPGEGFWVNCPQAGVLP